jgi:7-carboxy-7-deazaguanine synthase
MKKIKYGIKKIFGATIQGEGSMSGTVCNFIRFTGCNRWDGRPETRTESDCPFCDTDFYKGSVMDIDSILTELNELDSMAEWITLSGGEPALQLAKNPDLVYSLKEAGYKLAIETNGSIDAPVFEDIDHVTLSPKQTNDKTHLRKCDTIKLLYPHPNPLINPESFKDFNAEQFYLQPIEPIYTRVLFGSKENIGPFKNTQEKLWRDRMKQTAEYCCSNPKWKLSAQIHKWIDVE